MQALPRRVHGILSRPRLSGEPVPGKDVRLLYDREVIPVRLSRLLISENSDQQVIWLSEIDGERSFPIVIGIVEAAAIDRNLKSLRSPRPLTHDLLARCILELGAYLERVEIVALREETFYAQIVVFREEENDPVELDCRPSDAIALAIGAERPIFVDESVLVAASD